MLPKRKRVTKDLFSHIMKNGRVLSSPLFTLRYINQKTPQYAFVAPKTIIKQAVSRNKLRRKGYAVLSQTKTLPNVLGVFFYKKQANTASFLDIRTDIEALINKITF